MQTLELQQADNLDDLCAELLQQVDSRLKRTAGSDQVIDNDDLHPRLDVIAVYLDGLHAVLQLVGHAGRCTRQLALLADRNECLMQIIRHRCTEQESAGFQTGDRVKLYAVQQRSHLVHRQMEAVRVTEHCGNIAEDNAFLRKIRNAGDILLNLTHETSISSLSLPPGRESIMLFCHLASKTAIHFIYYQIVSFVTRD